MSSLRIIRSFTVEMLKIAADIGDADIRKLLTERRGREYLDGGRLPTNTFEEMPPLIKMAIGGYSPSHEGAVAAGNYDLKARTKKHNAYQNLRDYTTTGMKGALTGLGVLGATNAMRGRFGALLTSKDTLRAARQARRAATVGGSAAILDRAYRHDDFPYHGDLRKEALVQTGIRTPFHSPQEELAREGETGKFESGVIHDFGRPPKTVQLGKKFRIP